MQKEVAEQIGISRGHYIDYEVGYVDYYPKEVVDRLADFYHIPVEDLLDEYNLFLYKGQGKMLKECREKMGLKKKPFARMLCMWIQILTGTGNQIKKECLSLPGKSIFVKCS